MSDGGETEGKIVEQNNSIDRVGANDFGTKISRIAVAQVCESIGFEGFNESALDSLAELAIRYLCDLGKTSRFFANVAGRNECNVFDIVQGLEDLSMAEGTSGAIDVRSNCLLSSGVVKKISEYLETAEEIPFAQPVSQFPVIREQRRIPSFLQIGETPKFKHIPAWLPAFPDAHTYIHTPIWNERSSDPRTDKIELARQRRKAERSLLTLQQRLVCNGSSVAASSGEKDNGENNSRERDNSCSPAIPTSKVSSEAQGDKHHSLLETFAPAIEAMKDNFDSGSDEEKIMPNKRISFFLDLKKGKKVFGEPLELRIRKKTAPWFGREDEKDDKKRRVEFILRQSLENQLELPQL